VREGADYGRDERGVWVRGPWELAAPSTDVDDVIDQLCPAVMRLPDARGHDDGVEYCGLLYVGGDGQFHASVPSRLPASGLPGPTKNRHGPIQSVLKTCSMPLRVNDPGGVRSVEADFHSHPWPNSPLTPGADTGTRHQRYSIRIQFDTTCHVLKLVPHLSEPIPGELFERVGRSWNRIRVIPVSEKDEGTIRPPFEVP
jgi:hypothetical protein